MVACGLGGGGEVGVCILFISVLIEIDKMRFASMVLR